MLGYILMAIFLGGMIFIAYSAFDTIKTNQKEFWIFLGNSRYFLRNSRIY